MTGEGDGLGLTEGEGEGVGVGVGVGLAEGEGVGVGLGLGEGLGDGEGEGDGVGDGVGVGEAQAQLISSRQSGLRQVPDVVSQTKPETQSVSCSQPSLHSGIWLPHSNSISSIKLFVNLQSVS